MSDHDVRHDRAGFGDRPRLTCYSEGCAGATLVAQPYMSQGVWDDLVAMFMLAHRSTRLACADRGGPVMTYDFETTTFTREASPRSEDRHEARMAQRRPVLVARLNDLGYVAREAGLGGNITGIEVATLTGHAWVITDDHGDWLIGSDDEDRTDDEAVATVSLGTAIESVAHWADRAMGFDRPNHKEST